MDFLDIVSNTTQAAFAVSEKGRIVVWNKAAEKLLGPSADQVLGRASFQVFRGKDLYGNPFCTKDCNLRKVWCWKAARRFEIDIPGSSGEYIRVTLIILCVLKPRDNHFTVIHLLEPVKRNREMEDLISGILASARLPGSLPRDMSEIDGQLQVLTIREIEVLRMISAGSSTPRIAKALRISVGTVRTHIEHLLRKLGVHSRLEAASLALRYKII